MICGMTKDKPEEQITGRDYWMLRHDQAIARLRRTRNRDLAAIYLKLADHYQALATICGGSTGRISRKNTTLAM